MARRTVLIQASSSAIPAYIMHSNLLLGKVLEGIDRVNRNFLWGSIENKGKMHWVGWKKVTRPKDEGGLGIQIAKGRNTTLLAKLNWRFHTEDKAPWAKVLRMKYCNPQRLNSTNADLNQWLLATGLQVKVCYPRYHREIESILLCDCPLSKVMWHQLGRQANNSNFFTLSL